MRQQQGKVVQIGLIQGGVPNDQRFPGMFVSLETCSVLSFIRRNVFQEDIVSCNQPDPGINIVYYYSINY